MEKITISINAQEARQALSTKGYIPLVKTGTGEHWVRDSHHVILYWENDIPEKVELDDAKYVEFVRLDSGEIMAV